MPKQTFRRKHGMRREMKKKKTFHRVHSMKHFFFIAYALAPATETTSAPCTTNASTYKHARTLASSLKPSFFFYFFFVLIVDECRRMTTLSRFHLAHIVCEPISSSYCGILFFSSLCSKTRLLPHSYMIYKYIEYISDDIEMGKL